MKKLKKELKKIEKKRINIETMFKNNRRRRTTSTINFKAIIPDEPINNPTLFLSKRNLILGYGGQMISVDFQSYYKKDLEKVRDALTRFLEKEK